MALFCDIMILAVALAMVVIRADLVPIEQLGDLLLPFTKYLTLAMVVFFLLKYVVYEIREIGLIRQDKAAGSELGTHHYLLLAVYPLCDIGRLFIAIGILSAMLFRITGNYSLVNPFVDHVIYIALILIAVMINYWSYDAETIRFNAISTAVFAVAVVALSRGMFVQGLQSIL